MSILLLKPLHHVVVAHSLAYIKTIYGGEEKNALEIALAELTEDYRESFFALADNIGAIKNNFGESFAFDELPLPYQFASITHHLNMQACMDESGELKQHSAETILVTRPFPMGIGDTFTALRSILAQCTYNHHTCYIAMLALQEMAWTIKKVYFCSQAGISYDDMKSRYNSNATLEPSNMVDTLWMAQSFMKFIAKTDGKYDSKNKYTNIDHVYKVQISKLIKAQNESNIKKLSRLEVLLNDAYEVMRTQSGTLNRFNLLDGNFTKSLIFLTLKTISNDSAEHLKKLIKHHTGIHFCSPKPSMRDDGGKGVYLNLLDLFCLYETLKPIDIAVADFVFTPLIDHLEDCYLESPDGKSWNITKFFSSRKKVGRIQHHNGTYEYKAVLY